MYILDFDIINLTDHLLGHIKTLNYYKYQFRILNPVMFRFHLLTCNHFVDRRVTVGKFVSCFFLKKLYIWYVISGFYFLDQDWNLYRLKMLSNMSQWRNWHLKEYILNWVSIKIHSIDKLMNEEDYQWIQSHCGFLCLVVAGLTK